MKTRLSADAAEAARTNMRARNAGRDRMLHRKKMRGTAPHSIDSKLPPTVTKNKKPAALPMSDYVFDLLVARRALGKDKFIFPGPGKAGYISDLQSAFGEIEGQTGIKISAHDLRRGFVTTAE